MSPDIYTIKYTKNAIFKFKELFQPLAVLGHFMVKTNQSNPVKALIYGQSTNLLLCCSSIQINELQLFAALMRTCPS
jgi:hypothetical protein